MRIIIDIAHHRLVRHLFALVGLDTSTRTHGDGLFNHARSTARAPLRAYTHNTHHTLRVAAPPFAAFSAAGVGTLGEWPINRVLLTKSC